MNRKEKAEITRNRIFETAVKMIQERGYDNVSVGEICEKSGVAKGTFYVHYQSKEDIIKESYYFDMGNYVKEKLNNKFLSNKTRDIKAEIINFLLLELMFTRHIGFDMTCRAFVTNFSECLTGKGEHLKRREFTEKLKVLINEGLKEGIFKTESNEEEIFLYLESFIRGFMASWCFSNAEFDIIEEGKKYIQMIVQDL